MNIPEYSGDAEKQKIRQEPYSADMKMWKIWHEVLGDTCVCCGKSRRDGFQINYHHILPINQGGDNRITNIVPVCNMCHMAIHHEKHRNEYADYKTGRKRVGKSGCNMSVLEDWLYCRIGTEEAKQKLHLSKGSRLTCLTDVKDLKKKLGIKSTWNAIDFRKSKGHVVKKGEVSGYWTMCDGTRKAIYK